MGSGTEKALSISLCMLFGSMGTAMMIDPQRSESQGHSVRAGTPGSSADSGRDSSPAYLRMAQHVSRDIDGSLDGSSTTSPESRTGTLVVISRPDGAVAQSRPCMPWVVVHHAPDGETYEQQ